MRIQAHKQRGFTFVEVMIVAVVAAILVISALPDPESSRRRSALELMLKFEADVAYAQSMSVARPDEPLVIRVDAATNSYWLAKVDSPDTPILHPRTKQPYVVVAGDSKQSAYPGVDITGVDSGGTNTLVFNSTGGLDVDTSSFLQVASGDTRLQLEISNATGEIELSHDHGANIGSNVNGQAKPEGEIRK